jgi:hypothetical protein
MNRLEEKIEGNKKRLVAIEKKIQNLQKERELLIRKISLQELELKKNTLIDRILKEENSDESN